jgi:septal ring factor EnvC (AmiA/AmiB activator)
MIKFLFCCAITLMVASCGESATEERKDGFSKRPGTAEDSLFDAVMHGHDTAMAKMGKLRRYQKEVQQKIDSLAQSSGAKSSFQATLKQLEADLKQAEEGMNKWMEDFSIDSAQNDLKRRIEYLQSEKIKVDGVAEKIFSTISKADSMLRQ